MTGTGIQALIQTLGGIQAAPDTGDGFRPWIAAVVLIASVIVLVVMLLVGKRSDTEDETYRDEDE